MNQETAVKIFQNNLHLVDAPLHCYTYVKELGQLGIHHMSAPQGGHPINFRHQIDQHSYC
jgi:hypothetical protein